MSTPYHKQNNICTQKANKKGLSHKRTLCCKIMLLYRIHAFMNYCNQQSAQNNTYNSGTVSLVGLFEYFSINKNTDSFRTDICDLR